MFSLGARAPDVFTVLYKTSQSYLCIDGREIGTKKCDAFAELLFCLLYNHSFFTSPLLSPLRFKVLTLPIPI